MLVRFDPFRDFNSLARMMFSQQDPARPAAIPMDAYRDGGRFVVKFDLPGIDPDTIDRTVEKNVLTVRAERTWEAGEGTEVVVQERPQGTFVRQLFLGESLDPDRVEVSYDKGVLTLVIPLAEQAKAPKVQVSAEATGGEVPAGKTGSEDAASAA